MPINNEQSSDGIENFMFTAILNALADVNTSNMATITAISEDRTKLDVTIDTSKEELPDLPFITLSGGDNYLQFPISVGDKCLIIFSKDTVEDWLGGENQLVYSSDFNINNGFALVGINNSLDSIPIPEFVDFNVPSKIKISNDTEDMVTLLSDTIQFLSDTSNLLSTTTVIITEGSSAGTYPISTAAGFTALKAQIDALKVKFDTFKV